MPGRFRSGSGPSLDVVDFRIDTAAWVQFDEAVSGRERVGEMNRGIRLELVAGGRCRQEAMPVEPLVDALVHVPEHHQQVFGMAV